MSKTFSAKWSAIFGRSLQVILQIKCNDILSEESLVSYYLPRRIRYFAGRIIAADTAMHLRHQCSSSSCFNAWNEKRCLRP